MTRLGGDEISGEKYQQKAHLRSQAWIACIFTDCGPINGFPKIELLALSLSLRTGSNVFNISVLTIDHFLQRSENNNARHCFLSLNAAIQSKKSVSSRRKTTVEKSA